MVPLTGVEPASDALGLRSISILAQGHCIIAGTFQQLVGAYQPIVATSVHRQTLFSPLQPQPLPIVSSLDFDIGLATSELTPR